MMQPDEVPERGLPDLTGISLTEAGDMADSVLSRSLRLLSERLNDGQLPLNSFHSTI
jgi:hypothetical protein